MATDPPPEQLPADPTDSAAATGRVVAGESSTPRSKPRAVVRALLLAGFVGVALAFGLDRWARHQMQAAFEAVDSAQQSDHESGRLRAADVHQLIGREPDEPAGPPWNVEVYRWRGAREFSLLVQYNRDGDLKDVAAGSRPSNWQPAGVDAVPEMDGPE